MNPEPVIDSRAELGEGPSWDGKNGVLYWVDILRGEVHTYDPERSLDSGVRTKEYVSCVVPRRSGGVAVTLRHGFFTLDLRDGRLSPLAEAEKDMPSNRFNDGKCDSAGRFWAGTMNMERERGRGALYRLVKNEVRKVLSGVSTSNGLGWSPDNTTMYYIDTPTRRVSAFDYDLGSGALKNPRTVVDFAETDQPGDPDGMAVDAEGMLWVAHWGGYRVTRWNPETGSQTDSVTLPAAHVTSCCFGGRSLDELYITSARVGLSAQALSAQPHAGSLFRVKAGAKGLPTSAFDG